MAVTATMPWAPSNDAGVMGVKGGVGLVGASALFVGGDELHDELVSLIQWIAESAGLVEAVSSEQVRDRLQTAAVAVAEPCSSCRGCGEKRV